MDWLFFPYSLSTFLGSRVISHNFQFCERDAIFSRSSTTTSRFPLCLIWAMPVLHLIFSAQSDSGFVRRSPLSSFPPVYEDNFSSGAASTNVPFLALALPSSELPSLFFLPSSKFLLFLRLRRFHFPLACHLMGVGQHAPFASYRDGGSSPPPGKREPALYQGSNPISNERFEPPDQSFRMLSETRLRELVCPSLLRFVGAIDDFIISLTSSPLYPPSSPPLFFRASIFLRSPALASG